MDCFSTDRLKLWKLYTSSTIRTETMVVGKLEIRALELKNYYIGARDRRSDALLAHSIGECYNSSLHLGGVLRRGHVTCWLPDSRESSGESSESSASSASLALRASSAESCFRARMSFYPSFLLYNQPLPLCYREQYSRHTTYSLRL